MASRGRPKKTDAHGAKTWLQKIERAKKVKEKWKERFRVQVAYDYYEGMQKPPHIPQDEWISINLMYATLEAELPTLYATDPYFYLKLRKAYKPQGPDQVEMLEKRGAIRQAMLNYLKTEIGLKQKARLSIKDAHFQFGVCKARYEVEEEDNPKAGEPMLDEDGFPMATDDAEAMLEPDTLISREAYALTRIHPDDFLVDADAGPLEEDVSWFAHRIKMSLDKARKDKRYTAAGRKAVQATEVSGDDEKAREQRKGLAEMPKDEAKPDTVVMWEIWDLEEEQWLVVAEGMNDEWMLAPAAVPKGVEKHPFSTLRFSLRDDSWYPYPPMSPRIDSQREYSETRSKIMTHRKRFNRMYECATAMLEDESELAKLEAAEDGTVIRTTQPGVEVVRPIRDAPVDQNAFTELAFLRKDFDELATGSNQRGSGTGIDSATEAGIIENRVRVREGDRISIVSDFVVDVGRKLDQLVSAYLTEDVAVKVSGPEGELWAIVGPSAYTNDDIKAEWEYSVNVGATTPQLPEIERAQWTAFLQLIASAPQLALSKSLLTEMAKLHHIENEKMIEELQNIAKMIMGGQMQQPGVPGSLPNVATGGTAANTQGGQAAGINNIRGGVQ